MHQANRSSALPAPRTALIGRERDLAAIWKILGDDETRLLTLSGVGGCGKTRLALQLAGDLAANYPQRNWVVELSAVAEPELLPSVVAEALGLQESGSTSSTTALIAQLQSAPALLLIDNCEHLVDACALFINTLLAACPALRVIATSREPLHIAGERQYRVPPLDIPNLDPPVDVDAIAASPAVQLFTSRAQAVLPSFELARDNAESVGRICVRLEGIPLALELAAARVHVLGIQQILRRLDDSFRLLIGGNRVAPTRHQTLRATLEWSDGLLTSDERAVFRRLAVFNGEFRLAAAEAVCADAEIPSVAVLDILAGLADKSLVVTESSTRSAWYRLLEPLRQYALELLDASGESSAIRTLHAAFYLDLAQRAADKLRGPEQEQWLRRLEREQANLRAALTWTRQTDPALELRFVVALAPFWEIHGHLREGMRRLRGALERSESKDDNTLRAQALTGAGRLALYFDQTSTAHETDAVWFTRESLQLARELGDAPAIASALRDLGMIYRVQRAYARAIECLEEALAIVEALDDEPGAMRVQLHLGLAMYRAERTPDDRPQATRMFQESLKRLREFGDMRIVGIAQVLLGLATQDRGDLSASIRQIADGMSTHHRLEDEWLVASDLLVLSEVLLDAGRPRQAVLFVGAAQALSDRLGGSLDQTSFADIAKITNQINALRREEWFDGVWTESHALGAEEAVLAAHALLDEQDARAPSVTSDTLTPEPLTRRQLQVARLLAEEYSDRQIADALFIAPSTVASHVHQILQKLELRSRVQVAEWLATQEQSPGDTA